jgi:hypothetical protein
MTDGGVHLEGGLHLARHQHEAHLEGGPHESVRQILQQH